MQEMSQTGEYSILILFLFLKQSVVKQRLTVCYGHPVRLVANRLSNLN